MAAKAHSQHRLIDIVWGPEAGAAPLLPQHIDYRDSLSGDFQLIAACVASRPDLDTSALPGRSIGVGLISAQGRRRRLTGIITGAHRAGLHGGLPQVNLQIGSALALLAHRRACRVFQDISVPDIVALILDEHRYRNPRIAAAFEHTRQLLREHPPRSYCVQFNESDHAFMERLLAEEGISYHFHFSVDQLQPRHCLHLSDSGLFDPDRARPLRYRTALTEDRDDDLQEWQERHHLVPSTVTLSSYDYASAQVQQGSDDSVLDRELPASDATLGLQAHEAQTLYYASGNQDLDRYARLRMQARELRARTWLGEGQLRTLVTGDAVTIEQHPLHAAQASAGRSFLVTGIHLEACNNLPDAVPAGDGEGLTPGQCRTRFRAVPHDQTVVPAYADRLHRPT
ncbi:type VI secretion system Vgr family protein, partial [Stenotrophomonas sp. HMWF003]|uniref:type VI secretion system Vgr family protein n=1 Tax=Stenotrophomonas sp. HMWF003 TaxID=2056840 RepID=UPI0015E85B2B